MSNASLPEFDAWWNYSDPGETEGRFAALLAEVAGRAPADYRCELMTQLARTQGLQRRFEEARTTLATAEVILDECGAKARVRWLLESGRVANSSGDRDGSRPFFHEALESAEQHGLDNLAIDAAHMLGIVDDPAGQVRWNERAMAMAEASMDPQARRWLGSLYNNLGWTYHEQGDVERALTLWEKGLAFRVSNNQPREARIARWTVARGLRSLGRHEEALAMQRELLEDVEAEGEDTGYSHEEIAESLLALGRQDEAGPHFAEAHRRLAEDPWLQENEKARLDRLRELAGP
ncbi:MAG TPA: tetratricopeptide repeat protein [Fimbriimonadaceae bacterium]|nr:tetratricopeptide repeat protein [Fimbriimonadaceae bacterium]